MKNCVDAASVTAEIREHKPDKDGNPFTKREQCYITIATTANPNKTFTEIMLKKVIIPCAGSGVHDGGGDCKDGVL